MAATWLEVAEAIIAEAHAGLPADADLKARKQALSAARTDFFRSTSWGRKCWQKAARRYLDRYRQQPAAGLPLFGASPLERARWSKPALQKLETLAPITRSVSE